MQLLQEGDEKKVNLVLDDGRSLGLMIRGGAEYALGIYITGVDRGSAADSGGLKVGDQILEVNGRSFLSVPHDEAVRILKSSRHLIMTIKDVGRLPHARTVVDETKWIASSQIAESSATGSIAGLSLDQGSSAAGKPVFYKGVAGSQVTLSSLVNQSRAMLEEQARHLLTEPERQTMAYYLEEYRDGHIGVEQLVMALFELLNTHAKFSLLSEVRGLVAAQDVERFDSMVLRREIEGMKARQGQGAGAGADSFSLVSYPDTLTSTGSYFTSTTLSSARGSVVQPSRLSVCVCDAAPPSLSVPALRPAALCVCAPLPLCCSYIGQDRTKPEALAGPGAVGAVEIGSDGGIVAPVSPSPSKHTAHTLSAPEGVCVPVPTPCSVCSDSDATTEDVHARPACCIDVLMGRCRRDACRTHRISLGAEIVCNESIMDGGSETVQENMDDLPDVSLVSSSYPEFHSSGGGTRAERSCVSERGGGEGDRGAQCRVSLWPCERVSERGGCPRGPLRLPLPAARTQGRAAGPDKPLPSSPASNQHFVMVEVHRPNAEPDVNEVRPLPQARAAGATLSLSDSGQTLSEDSGVDIADTGGHSKDNSPRPAKTRSPRPGLLEPTSTLVRVRNTLGIAIEGGANTRQPLPRIVTIQEKGRDGGEREGGEKQQKGRKYQIRMRAVERAPPTGRAEITRRPGVSRAQLGSGRGGSAHNCGKLKVGHVILEVNGVSLRGREHREAARMIAEAFKTRERDYIDFLVTEFNVAL
ncbi:WHRN protein, partial [Atractosteus spatula]|nr:WHRN protein [Atractosteus spatula]